MKAIKDLLVLFFFVGYAWGAALEEDENNYLRSLLRRQVEEEQLESLMKRSYMEFGKVKRGTFDCKERNQQCSVVSKCCGTLQCYRERGFSMTTPGVCVDCIRQGQLCQRDTQCCTGLVCQKGGLGYTDGSCDVKRPTGGKCHENDQCQSNNCNITPWQVLSREEGSCA